jgi:hypothetical protein
MDELDRAPHILNLGTHRDEWYLRFPAAVALGRRYFMRWIKRWVGITRGRNVGASRKHFVCTNNRNLTPLRVSSNFTEWAIRVYSIEKSALNTAKLNQYIRTVRAILKTKLSQKTIFTIRRLLFHIMYMCRYFVLPCGITGAPFIDKTSCFTVFSVSIIVRRSFVLSAIVRLSTPFAAAKTQYVIDLILKRIS